jgi:alpha-tubulin suppressor-like RCC1 family protein
VNKTIRLIVCLCFSLSAAGRLHAEILQLAAGGIQSVALITGGDVFEWGGAGQALPGVVFGLDRIKSIAAGKRHALALRSDGTVWAWGSNSAGQLGNGTVIDTDRPRQVMDIAGAVAIAAAGNQSYALKNDGTVWAWGANQIGQLGDKTTQDRRGPVVVEGLIDVTAIAAGETGFVALRKSGDVCALGALSVDRTLNCDSAFHSAIAVAADAEGIYVLLRDGTVHTMGKGRCGRNFRPEDVIIDNVTTIAAGPTHLMLLRDDGTVWACGTNNFGQLGDATQIDTDRPVRVAGSLSKVTQIAAGSAHSLAATDAGIWTWGDNSAGQLGTGNTTPRLQPGPVWDGTGRLR